ncbi:hypothetical protein SAMN06266787_10810 [Halorubrum ezzemoulense]|uniref:PIN domain-containing protein n=1 Tax=Halorubrum ezzemoulense TaxID=337243 RepID=A0A238Y1M7_HALEZ|nr:PIN domain-containing protein [Halorubrum ezzemoulense]SNR65206.1 hypothetical protein SAMN06266787_10810 [Halorubrum ezzemoulense]
MAPDDLPDSVFADTGVLLNYLQREWERDRSTELIDSTLVDVVVSERVISELESVTDRRQDIYEDLLDYLLRTDSDIEDYDPSDRRVYVGEHDGTHIREVQMTLASLDDSREVLRRLRRFLRAVDRRLEYLQETLAENTVDPLAPLEVELAINTLIDHGPDASIVTDAAAWTANGGSGMFVTLDQDDLLNRESEIAAVLNEKQGPDWVIRIRPPDQIVID